MGIVFVICGLLLATLHLLAGGVFLILACIIFYYAPRWNLRIELNENSIHFSENVVEITPVELPLRELLEIRRVEEKELRKGFLATFPDAYAYIEFETRQGKVYRMHDIFSDTFDTEITELGTAAGVRFVAFSREVDREPEIEENDPQPADV
jgi:hypothetical protein